MHVLRVHLLSQRVHTSRPSNVVKIGPNLDGEDTQNCSWDSPINSWKMHYSPSAIYYDGNVSHGCTLYSPRQYTMMEMKSTKSTALGKEHYKIIVFHQDIKAEHSVMYSKQVEADIGCESAGLLPCCHMLFAGLPLLLWSLSQSPPNRDPPQRWVQGPHLSPLVWGLKGYFWLVECIRLVPLSSLIERNTRVLGNPCLTLSSNFGRHWKLKDNVIVLRVFLKYLTLFFEI